MGWMETRRFVVWGVLGRGIGRDAVRRIVLRDSARCVFVFHDSFDHLRQ